MQHLTYYWIDILIEHLLKIINDVSIFLILALLKTSLHITHHLLFSHICIFPCNLLYKHFKPFKLFNYCLILAHSFEVIFQTLEKNSEKSKSSEKIAEMAATESPYVRAENF